MIAAGVDMPPCVAADFAKAKAQKMQEDVKTGSSSRFSISHNEEHTNTWRDLLRKSHMIRE